MDVVVHKHGYFLAISAKCQNTNVCANQCVFDVLGGILVLSKSFLRGPFIFRYDKVSVCMHVLFCELFLDWVIGFNLHKSLVTRVWTSGACKSKPQFC